MGRLFLILLLLLTLLLGLAFLFQGSRGIWQPDEGYYVGTAITMLEKQKIITPYLGEDEIFLDKPPATYWGIIGGLKLFGHNEFAVRFFHGISFMLTAMLTGLLGWELFKDKFTALLAVFIYSTMTVPFIAANFVTPDTLLALWTTMAVLFFWKSAESGTKRNLWKILLCMAVGLGFFTKGPAVLIPCCGMFVFLAVRKQLIEYFWTPWWIAGLGLFIIVGLWWYILICVKVPGAFSYFFDSQIWGRLVSEKYERNPGLSGAFIYLPVLIFGSLPWSIIWIDRWDLIAKTFFSKNFLKILADSPAVLLLLCWFFIPLLILCLASSKLGLYSLPLFPALALATARLWRNKLFSTDSGIRINLKTFLRPAVLCCTWVVLLISTKLALAYYPTPNDMKALWSRLCHHLPQSNSEVGTIDKRCDGLLFYGVKEVEHLTAKTNPYPSFSETEYFLDEIKEMINEKDVGFLLVQGSDRAFKIRNILNNAGIDSNTIVLPYQRTLLELKLHNQKN